MQVPEVFFVNPNGLRDHPLLASIPALDEQSSEFQALLASIRDRGVDYPIILDEDDRIMDGRTRARAAAKASAECPAMRRSSREASEIILASLVDRRHLPKGALAYLSVTLFDKAVESGRQRKLANMVPGAIHRKPTQLAIEGSAPKADQSAIGKTAQQLAAEMGFSDELYRQAMRVRELFERTEERVWHDGPREVRATFRGWFEPKIFTGEIGLGAIIQAISGKDATEGKTPEKRDLPTLVRKGFTDLKNRFSRWETIPVDTRRELTAEIANDAAEWPEDVRQKVAAALEQAAAHKPKKPGF
jgi:hypothetical protein